MERLTEKHYGNGNGYYVKCSETCHSICCDGCERDAEPVDRLGQIEDILGDTYDLDRLRELVEADKKGLCVVIPADKEVTEIMYVLGLKNNRVCNYVTDAISEKILKDFKNGLNNRPVSIHIHEEFNSKNVKNSKK